MTVVLDPVKPITGTPLQAIPTPLALSLNSFGTILDLAIREHVEPGAMDRLYALYDRMKKDDAESQFNVAIQRFQAACPPIVHNQTANISSRDPNKKGFGYSYADLPQIASTIKPLLDANGLSFSFTSRMAEKKFVVVCKVHHVAGHSRESEFPCEMWAGGSMNAAQQVKSTMTFGQRCALILALGITTAQTDDDGNSLVSATDKPAANVNAPKSATRAERAEKRPHPANALFNEWKAKLNPQGVLTEFAAFCQAELETGDDMSKPESFSAGRVTKLREILGAMEGAKNV